MIMKRVSYSITIVGEPEDIYKIRNSDGFWFNLARAEANGTIRIRINRVREEGDKPETEE